MNKITIPYHLIIPAAVGIIALILIFFYRKRLFEQNKLLWITIIVFIAVYTFMIGRAAYEDIYCQWNLSRYDINQDGFFMGPEVNKEQEAAMKMLINNVGKGFSFTVGFVFASVLSIIVFVAGSLLKSKKK